MNDGPGGGRFPVRPVVTNCMARSDLAVEPSVRQLQPPLLHRSVPHRSVIDADVPRPTPCSRQHARSRPGRGHCAEGFCTPAGQAGPRPPARHRIARQNDSSGPQVFACLSRRPPRKGQAPCHYRQGNGSVHFAASGTAALHQQHAARDFSIDYLHRFRPPGRVRRSGSAAVTVPGARTEADRRRFCRQARRQGRVDRFGPGWNSWLGYC
jgi:hypothetical protein